MVKLRYCQFFRPFGRCGEGHEARIEGTSMDSDALGGTRIYLDHAATTPVDPAVVEAMLPHWTLGWGNPSSLYGAGRAARTALDGARGTVARTLNCAPGEIIFTSGGTEGDNLALKGPLGAARAAGRGAHLITSAIEHHAVLDAADRLEREGVVVTRLAVDGEGFVDPAAVEAAIRPDTGLISIMYANNEIGTVEPLAQIGAIARARGVPFHTDAVQAAGSLPLDVDALGVDLLTIAAHKFYGPKGVGALYVRAGTPMLWQQQGGPQEGDRRGGTEAVPQIVGLAEALSRAEAERPAREAHCRALRDRLTDGLLTIPGARLNGPAPCGPRGAMRLANNVNVAFPGVEGESLIIALDLAGVAASSGSACTTGATEPSHVLRAIGVPEELIAGSLRLTVGRDNTPEQIEEVLALLPTIVGRLRDA